MKKGYFHVSDGCVTTQSVPQLGTGFLNDRLFARHDVSGQPQPYKNEQAAQAACYPKNVS